MDWLWTWGGTSFGFRDGNSLFTHNGVEAARFYEDELYGADGAYLGELNNGKLLTNTSNKAKRKNSFTPQRRLGVLDHLGQVGTLMYLGYEDFPSPQSFR